MVLSVGDFRRPSIGWAVYGSLVVAVLFEGFAWGVKELPPLGDHVPWADDPYDVATSFAVFFVPLLVAVTTVRVLLCRRAHPLPLSRVRDVLRGCGAILAVVVVTMTSDWASVFASAGASTWSAVTPPLVAGLAILSVLTVAAILALASIGRRLPTVAADTAEVAGADWLADGVELGRLVFRRLSAVAPVRSSGRSGLRLLDGIDRRIVEPVRRHPTTAAAVVAALFAVSLATAMVAGEGLAPILILVVAVAWCAMFAFLILAGAYLGIVRPTIVVVGWRRRGLDAIVVACLGVVAALAFRDGLWALFAPGADTLSLGNLTALLGAVGVMSFGIVLGAEMAAGAHRP